MHKDTLREKLQEQLNTKDFVTKIFAAASDYCLYN